MTKNFRPRVAENIYIGARKPIGSALLFVALLKVNKPNNGLIERSRLSGRLISFCQSRARWSVLHTRRRAARAQHDKQTGTQIAVLVSITRDRLRLFFLLRSCFPRTRVCILSFRAQASLSAQLVTRVTRLARNRKRSLGSRALESPCVLNLRTQKPLSKPKHDYKIKL